MSINIQKKNLHLDRDLQLNRIALPFLLLFILVPDYYLLSLEQHRSQVYKLPRSFILYCTFTFYNSIYGITLLLILILLKTLKFQHLLILYVFLLFKEIQTVYLYCYP